MRRCVILALALALCAGVTAQAAVIYVDTDATGANDGSSWTDAYTDLQTALGLAASGDEIWVAEGTYRPTTGSDRTISFTLVEGAQLYGGFAGTESARDERDWEVHVTILTGDLNGDDVGFTNNGENAYHVVSGASNATLDGFTVTRGNANAGGWPDDGGGGMHNNGATNLTVANCMFSSNSASSFGGGIYGAVSSLIVTNCTFSGDSAERGGGMCNWYSSPTVTDCTFSGNEASIEGGGVYSHCSDPTITDCAFLDNTATDTGGGICCILESVPVIIGCTFSGNSAGLGGGLYSGWDSTPTVGNCSFLGNGASYGGGMCNWLTSSPSVANCTFSGNSANERGGGMCNWLTSSPSVANCTFSGNTAGTEGGGVFGTDTSFTVTNCIIWGNSAPDGPEIYSIDGQSCALSYSDVGQVGGFTDGGGNINADPLFVDADGTDGVVGTLDDDLHLQAGSPCIDAADGDAAPGTDRDGLLRHDDPATTNTGVGAINYTDIGAYEFEGAVTGSVTGKVILEDGADSGVVTITADGQTAVKNISGNTIQYTIENVPGSSAGVCVETTEATHEPVGSPAPITWVATDGTAADVTVRARRGTVTGIVTLEEGADAAFVTITAAGRTATKDVVSDTIEYTITDVPVTATDATVSTTDPRYEAIGSPASIAWAGTEGTAANTSLRALRGTVTGTVALQDGADPGLVTITAGGQTGSKSVVGDTIEYTVSDVSVLTAEVTVETAEVGYAVFGSPAPITWTGTAGVAVDTTVCVSGMVTGTVILEDGADAGLVTITACGQAAVTNIVGDTIEYTITGVPILATEVDVATNEGGYEAAGSPASITWTDTTGTAAEVTVRIRRAPTTHTAGGCSPGAIPFASLALAGLAALATRRASRAGRVTPRP